MHIADQSGVLVLKRLLSSLGKSYHTHLLVILSDLKDWSLSHDG